MNRVKKILISIFLLTMAISSLTANISSVRSISKTMYQTTDVDNFKVKIESQSVFGRNTKINYNINTDSETKYNITDYLTQLMDMSFGALKFIVVIIILALSVAFVVWWILFVFKTFPRMLADLTKRIDESYGFMGVFIFVVLFFPSLLVFIIAFLTRNIDLLIGALEGLLGDLLQDDSIITAPLKRILQLKW